MAAKREQGDRGAQISPIKQLVSVRYGPEVLELLHPVVRGGNLGWMKP